jgi:hypothetical protein
MAHMISQLLEDPAMRASMGASAHESAQKYTFANQAAGFIEWFSEVIDDWCSLRPSHGKLRRKT